MVLDAGSQPVRVSHAHAQALGKVGNSLSSGCGIQIPCPSSGKLVMMHRMNGRILTGLMALYGLLVWPALALAQRRNDQEELGDARYEGFTPNVELADGSTALTWLLLVFLGMLCVGV